ncbi:MAG: hypothetical protein PHU46_14920 [Rhodocyclaceae bacterium]|nr:hypothetical protein [Rhodocyclaceae bacterium]
MKVGKADSRRSPRPLPLPPGEPTLAPVCYEAGNRAAELALARLSGVSGLVTTRS